MTGTVHHQVGPEAADNLAHPRDALLGCFVLLAIDCRLRTKLSRELQPRRFRRADADHPASAISCAAAIARMPIGPEPWMTTVSPHLKPPARAARLKARMQEVKGSAKAPRRSDM